ncbi:hypothetical protein BT96DRAFT_937838 [Gymnopus androsaceus JB14]|uniref:Uncharacterized protein n=1 Tax=Gymnopus androsaceus JB14 TaxID=1447944 RepID=A0A6A4HUQ5_9AGAR|nr:hypothetical protein BT96DRAFT_937838 [Gymnopus androsaceus JB14]
MFQGSEGFQEPENNYGNDSTNEDFDRDEEIEFLSTYNKGKNVQMARSIANAAKPKLTGKAFHASENSNLEVFLDCVCLNVKGLGNSTTEWIYKIVADDLQTSLFKISWSMRSKTGDLIETVYGYEDMIEQLKGMKSDVKLLLEELVILTLAQPPPVPDAQPLDKNADDEGQKKKKSKVIFLYQSL